MKGLRRGIKIELKKKRNEKQKNYRENKSWRPQQPRKLS
jgi:hypothetical protein